MGQYTDYAWVKGRIGFDVLKQFLSDQVSNTSASDTVIDTELDTYVEDKLIAQIDARIDSACVVQVTVPVESTNKSFGLLEGIGEALLIRAVYAHSKHGDVPPKIENAWIQANMDLRAISTGKLLLVQDDDDGPGEDGDSVAVDVTSSEDTWGKA